MKIVIDENIPFAKETFGKLGEVTLLPGEAISPKTLQDAAILVVRSVTKVDESLLHGSQVQFVGTATAGLEHIDQDYLSANNILFASAQGANANSVAEYVITALLIHASRKGLPLKGKKLGIIGVGNIGKRIEQMATAIGMEVILNDPPLDRKTGDLCYRPLSETCSADFVTLHVPLIFEGLDATYHLFDKAALAALHPSTLIINTSRGDVIDNEALLHAIRYQQLTPPIIDVWEGEPDIRWELLRQVELGTPHIAGYALEGKVNGMLLIYQAVCVSLGVSPSCHLHTLPLPERPAVRIDVTDSNNFEHLAALVTQVYDLKGDDLQFRKILNDPPEARPVAFKRLRKHYPLRREFQSTKVMLKKGSQELRTQIVGLGFGLG